MKMNGRIFSFLAVAALCVPATALFAEPESVAASVPANAAGADTAEEAKRDAMIAAAESGNVNAQAAMSAYRRKEFSEAAYYLECATKQGDVRAQQMLGYRGGVRPDTSRISFKKRLAIKSAFENE